MTLDLKTLKRRGIFAAILLALVGLAILIWFRVAKEEWGPELATDPVYRSGRASLCKAPVAVGQMWPSEVQDIVFDQSIEASNAAACTPLTPVNLQAV